MAWEQEINHAFKSERRLCLSRMHPSCYYDSFFLIVHQAMHSKLTFNSYLKVQIPFLKFL